jgi:hypothetical protein
LNIFKVLSDGDGRLKEPNVSAFLAFLLDPKQAHGLDSTFLKQIVTLALEQHPGRDKLGQIWPKGQNHIADLSLKSPFEVEVDTEVKVELNGAGKKGRDIDILIEISMIREDTGDDFGTVQEEFVHAICIENKIRDSAIEEGQLLEEFDGLTNLYRVRHMVPSTGMTMLFVTPTLSDRANAAFQRFKSALGSRGHACHFVWKPVDYGASEQRDLSIYRNLAELMRMDHSGEIDPIHEHTKYIIKSFMSFIRSDFRSYEDESTKRTKAKDHGKYEFNGSVYSKSRLVLAVVGEHIRQKKPTFQALKNDFPDRIMPKTWRRKGLICRAEDVSPTDSTIGSRKRYFTDESELLTTSDGVTIAVNNLWDLEGIISFLEQAKRLGYVIKKVM